MQLDKLRERFHGLREVSGPCHDVNEDALVLGGDGGRFGQCPVEKIRSSEGMGLASE